MKLAPPLARWVESTAGLDAYYVEVDDPNPGLPYLIVAESSEIPTDSALCRTLDTLDVDLFVTVVDSTPGNVVTSRARVRSLLNPGRQGVTVNLPGATVFLKLSPEECRPIQVDKTTQPNAAGRHPCFAVDVYTAHITYLQEA